jgi:hypothetical protein
MVEKTGVDLAEAVKWLDGNLYSVSGKLVTRDERDNLDYPNLQKMRFGPLHESELAAKMNFTDQKDKRFRASLDRLCQKGCLIIKRATWDFRGFWADIADPTIAMTAKGSFLACERLPGD